MRSGHLGSAYIAVVRVVITVLRSEQDRAVADGSDRSLVAHYAEVSLPGSPLDDACSVLWGIKHICAHEMLPIRTPRQAKEHGVGDEILRPILLQ